uniref:E3 ubiquitin-protein ligase RNF133-like n=1 Tax=Sinocyclocheilus grahami TaxID=75366 RepID=A0A672LB80_SINGR
MGGNGPTHPWIQLLGFLCFQIQILWRGTVRIVFGADSPLDSASGLLVLPNSDPLACSRNTTFTAKHQPWIALIKKGNCTYSQKIRAAQRQGASAVVIYNIDGTGNDTNLMAHSDAKDIVAIMVGNILGTEMAKLVKNGSDVYVAIVVANPRGLWYSSTWAYSLSFTFIGVTTITMFYFAFLFIKRMYRNQQLRKENEKAIAKLEVRTLRTGDLEVESEDVSCVVCTDSFKHNEKVTVLPCRHLYHKKCIEPWLLEHPTCPMCKFHILKYKVSLAKPAESSTFRHDGWCGIYSLLLYVSPFYPAGAV